MLRCSGHFDAATPDGNRPNGLRLYAIGRAKWSRASISLDANPQQGGDLNIDVTLHGISSTAKLAPNLAGGITDRNTSDRKNVNLRAQQPPTEQSELHIAS